MSKRRAVVLLSGGVDSTTTAAIAKREGFEVYALSFRYGQRHTLEIEAARRVAAALETKEHIVVDVDLRQFGGSALTSDIAVPKGRSHDEIGHGIPVTYVPARNTIFLAFALAWAEVLGASDLFIGVNALDYSVGGAARVWVRTKEWARLMPISELCALPTGEYETVSLDRDTLQFEWRRVTGRFAHPTAYKRCFKIRLERGREIDITEDHSLFTVDPVSAKPVTVKGCQIAKGMPIVAPFDLSNVVAAWSEDLRVIELNDVGDSRRRDDRWNSVSIENDCLTNRLRRVRVPGRFQITDAFLYIVGLWLAEGGKNVDSRTPTLAFSIGGIPGAVDTLRSYFETFNVSVTKSPANEYDYAVRSSVFAAIFEYLGLFGTAKTGAKRFPSFWWKLSQRQRRIVVSGLWDGDGGHAWNGSAVLAQKSHALILDVRECLLLDAIFPVVKDGLHDQKLLIISRAQDFRKLIELYPFRHASKRKTYEQLASVRGRDEATGIWKCAGVWKAVAAACLPPGEETRIYNEGGKYDVSVRSRRSAFAGVPALAPLVSSKLAFLRVVEVREMPSDTMYDLSVEGAENFVADGVLAHNSGYPDCRPDYIEAFERMANLATKAGVEGRQRLKIHTPLIQLSKAQIIRKGLELGIDFAQTLSCYDPAPTGEACGQCDSCQLRLKGFAEAGQTDPITYRSVT